MHKSPPSIVCELWTKVDGFYTRSLHVQAVQKSGKWPIQLAEKPLVLAPGTVHRNMQVEEDPRPEDRLQFHPGFGADPLDHLAALSDDDALLRFASDHDRCVEFAYVLYL